jgi:DNA-binding response OmpR family regulator
VEGEKELRQLYQTELEREDYSVVTVAGGNEAMKKLRNEPVDLIVLALRLPDGFGLDFLQNFVVAKDDLRIVINTNCPTYKMDFRSWAADAFLLKSSDLGELRSTIDALLHSEKN